MSILIFIAILAVLIIVHEFGHFLVARFFGIRVDEFGIGYPPRALTFFTWMGTKFTLNWLPFGGFVKIFGENGPEAEATNGEVAKGKSFTDAPRGAQALVLLAGVTFNIIFAWLLLSVGFMSGLPKQVDPVKNPELVSSAELLIAAVSSGSPASEVGLMAGDTITAVYTANNVVEILTPDGVASFIASHGDEIINISFKRGNNETSVETLAVTPSAGILEDRKAVGISMNLVSDLSLPIHKAFWEGAKTTANLTFLTASGLGVFLFDAIRGSSDFSQVTGPVGIVGLVGDASELGFVYLISFTAFISINLAVINLVPFPALDGGRLLFVVIEAIKRSPISPKITNIVNAVGFLLLIGLMVLVTVNDVLKLF